MAIRSNIANGRCLSCAITQQLHRAGSISRPRRAYSRLNVLASEPLTVCLEGNISSGKSTFLNEVLSGETMREIVQVVPEPVQKWQSVSRTLLHEAPHNLLEEFYADPQRYAYIFQNYVFMTRFLQERETSAQEAGWLSELELDLYHAWSCPTIKALPSLIPDAFIYLKVAPEICMQRLRRRARGEELGVTLDYLNSLHDKHEKWLNKKVHTILTSGSHESLRVGKVKDHVCGTFTERLVLILDYERELEFGIDNEAVSNLRKQVLSFCAYVGESKKLRQLT